MTRRKLLIVLGAAALAVPLAALAQPAAKQARVGYLSDLPAFLHAPGAPRASLLREFRDGLHEHGYVAGENLAIEYRYAEGKVERLAELAAELVALKVDVVVPAGTASLRAARSATANIPIVALDLQIDPVADGFVASLGRPAGNVTGLFLDQPDMAGKWLELLKDAIPKISRAAVLWDSTTPPHQLKAVESAAKSLGVALQTLTVTVPGDFEHAFAAAGKARAQAVVILSSPMIASQGPHIAILAAAERIPTVSAFSELATAGCLMAYGPNLAGLYRRLGAIAGKVLNGARPGGLPVERPSRFDLVINLQTARALGITIPQSVLMRAHSLIE